MNGNRSLHQINGEAALGLVWASLAPWEQKALLEMLVREIELFRPGQAPEQVVRAMANFAGEFPDPGQMRQLADFHQRVEEAAFALLGGTRGPERSKR